MIRPVRRGDVPDVLAMVRELATYERSPESVVATEDDFAAALFADDPRVFAHVAEHDGELAGFAMWYLTFSTWTGKHGIWLDDLYVRPAHRRHGHARELLVELGRLATDRGYRRLDWWVLDWNSDAHAFYRSLGADPQDDWTVWRLEGPPLHALADPPVA